MKFILIIYLHIYGEYKGKLLLLLYWNTPFLIKQRPLPPLWSWPHRTWGGRCQSAFPWWRCQAQSPLPEAGTPRSGCPHAQNPLGLHRRWTHLLPGEHVCRGKPWFVAHSLDKAHTLINAKINVTFDRFVYSLWKRTQTKYLHALLINCAFWCSRVKQVLVCAVSEIMLELRLSLFGVSKIIVKSMIMSWVGYVLCHLLEVSRGWNDLPATTLQWLSSKSGDLYEREKQIRSISLKAELWHLWPVELPLS